MKPAIEIRNLGKEYTLTTAQRYLSLRDAVTNSFKNLFTSTNTSKEKFWALKDINLDIMPGERVGIIGSNGAGKSTLLKIISRITPPTIGEAIIRGRVGSLLEVGTGFHPELSGRENIYLNGSILGLTKSEINKQLDAIIDFSGVEKFIDTPLKHYSSGMQMRLAFAVAAHLKSDVLLIDEVLAVGDVEFQKKCIGKMEDVSKKEGRTVLFISHDINVIKRFCDKVIFLENGRKILEGETEKVLFRYSNGNQKTSYQKDWNGDITSEYNEIKLKKIWSHNKKWEQLLRYDTTETVGISFEYEALIDGLLFTHGLNLYNENGINIFDSHDIDFSERQLKNKKGLYQATVWIPGNLLAEGLFAVGVALFAPSPFQIFLHLKNIIHFEVYSDYTKKNAKGKYMQSFPGLIRPLLNWEIQEK